MKAQVIERDAEPKVCILVMPWDSGWRLCLLNPGNLHCGCVLGETGHLLSARENCFLLVQNLRSDLVRLIQVCASFTENIKGI